MRRNSWLALLLLLALVGRAEPQLISGGAASGGGSGTVTNVGTSAPLSGGPITTTGTIACPTCTFASSALTNNGLVLSGSGYGLTSLADVATGQVLASGGVGVAPLFTGSPTLSGTLTASAVATNGAANGFINFGNTTNANTLQFVSGVTGSNIVLTLPIANVGGFLRTQGSGSAPLSFASVSLANEVTGILPAANIVASVRTRGLAFEIGDPGGSALTAASTTTAYLTVPFACTVSAWNLLVDAGTITVKFWKIATGTAIPTSSNSITPNGLPITTATASRSATNASEWSSTTVAANDILAMNVTAVATAKYTAATLQCDQ